MFMSIINLTALLEYFNIDVYTMHNFWLLGGLGSDYVSSSYSGEL